MSLKAKNMKVRIKRGTSVFIDHRFLKWPVGKRGADTIFDAGFMDGTGNYLDCRALGFGAKSDYGNGSIFADLSNTAPADMKSACEMINILANRYSDLDDRLAEIKKAVV